MPRPHNPHAKQSPRDKAIAPGGKMGYHGMGSAAQNKGTKKYGNATKKKSATKGSSMGPSKKMTAAMKKAGHGRFR